jgi:hypothetical protein
MRREDGIVVGIGFRAEQERIAKRPGDRRRNAGETGYAKKTCLKSSRAEV